MTVDELVQLADSLSIVPEDLYGKVRTTTDMIRWKVNVGGISSQIRFLVEHGWSVKRMKEVLEDIRSRSPAPGIVKSKRN